jgi:hypothetical protein
MKTITTLCALFLALITTTAKAEPLRYALGLFESGAESFERGYSDFKRGNSGEVSRYQIMPEVWKRYSSTRDYHNPVVAWQVAEKILSDRVDDFRTYAHRDPNATELYLLWNKPGHFSAAHYSLKRVSQQYLARARRFANLYVAVQTAYRAQNRAQVRQVAMRSTAPGSEG